MPWPVTFSNGNKWVEEQFTGFAYPQNFPGILQDVADEASRVIGAVGTAQQLASTMQAGPVASIRRRGRSLSGVVTPTPMDASLVTPVIDWLFQPGYAPPSGAFGRPSTAYYRTPAGVLAPAGSGEMRFTSNATTGENQGTLIEDQRTNYFLQSAAPATQTISLAAGTYTLSVVEGTGSLVLSGGASGTATPTASVSFTLSGTASVTVTVSGAVTKAQLENGSFPTSFILTTTATVTRATDAFQWTLPANFWNTAEGSGYVDAISAPGLDNSQLLFEISDGGSSNLVRIYRDGGSNLFVQSIIGGTISGITIPGGWPNNTRKRIAFAIGGGTMGVSIDGGTVLTAAVSGLPPATTFRLGDRFGGGRCWNGTILQFAWVQRRIANAALPLISA